MLAATGGAVYYRFLYAPAHRAPGEIAYVLPPSLDVVDTPAELRNVVATIKAGDRVQVLAHTTNWAKIRVAGGRSGWVESKTLLDATTHQRGEQLLKELEASTPQAVGHTDGVTNLHLDPSRDSIVLAELPQNLKIEVFGRRLVPKQTAETGVSKAAPAVRDAWYLVRAGSQAGWVLGRLVDLDVPPALGTYAEGVNVVAWQVLRTVNDGGQQVPEYLVADRIGAENVDFNHIRVFTWWVKHHKYVTAYVESNLAGYFPIEVMRPAATRLESSAFRLRLVDSGGHRFQKVYGLFDTIVRPLGTVDGWESQAMPAPAAPKHRRGPINRRRAHR